MPDELTPEEQAHQMSLGARMARALKTPEMRKEALKFLKKADPTMQIPELELDNEIQKVRDDEKKERETLLARLEQQQNASDWEKLERQATSRGFKAADVTAFMTEKKVGDWNAAMDFMDNERQLATPTPASMTSLFPEDKDERKELFANPKKFAQKRAYAAIDELNKQRRIGI